MSDTAERTAAGGDLSRPALTLSEVAAACSVSRTTARRRLDAGAFPNAWREAGPEGRGTGAWRLPLEDVLAAGLTPHRRPDQPDPGEQVRQLTGALADRATAYLPDTGGQVRDLTAALAEQRRRADVAEAELAARREQIDDLRRAMRALEAGRSRPRRPASPSAPHRRPFSPCPPLPPHRPPNAPQHRAGGAGCRGSGRELDIDTTIGATFELLSGDVPIARALAAL